MGKAGYTGAQPNRTLAVQSYPGVWDSQEQYVEEKGGSWPKYLRLISRSLRFNSADSAFLSRTPGSAGNRTTWSFSTWIKRSQLGVLQRFFTGTNATNDNDWTAIFFNSSDQLVIGGYSTFFRTSNAVYRDCSAWYHLLVTADLGNGTDALKFRAWINNSEVTWSSTGSNPTTTGINSANNHTIGAEQSPNNGGIGSYFNGYLADVHFIDGQALSPSAFGEFDDNNTWQPREYNGTYGSNGFNLKFDNNSSNSAVGIDATGNSNNWTPNNFLVIGGNIASYTVTNTSDAFNAFDGSLSNAWFPNANSSSLLTFATPITGTTFRFYMGASLNTTGFQINGSAPSGFSGSKNTDWYDFSSHIGGTLRSIQLSYVPAQYSQYVYAIEVDGALLYDNRAAIGNDSLVDVPTSYGRDTGVGAEVRGNYCTWNELDRRSTGILSNGNLRWTASSSGGGYCNIRGTQALIGKVYFEAVVNAKNTAVGIGVTPGSNYAKLITDNSPSDYFGASAWGASSAMIYAGFETCYCNGSTTTAFPAVAVGSILMCAFDEATGKVWFGINGTWLYSGNPSTGSNPTFTLPTTLQLYPASTLRDSDSIDVNFGQRAWAYTAPTNFKALVDTNLPAPTIAKGSSAMDVVLYTGNGGTQTFTGLNLSPDFIWMKRRNSTTSHALYDIVRGVKKYLMTDGPNTEYEPASGGVTSFDSDGFTIVEQGGVAINQSSASMVAWTWDAGSNTVTDNAGSIQSTRRTNQTAGFSVVTYTGSSTNNTVGHGLGVTPALVIVKPRTTNDFWVVYHSALNNLSKYLVLNSPDGTGTSSNYWGTSGNWSSTTFGVSSGGGGNNNLTSVPTVAYCFAPVAGYSSFGSYVGNSSTDGPFVFTGMRPKFIMVKRSDAGGEPWVIHDSTRDYYNGYSVELYPNTSASEGGPYSPPIFDFLSNGFKLRSSTASAANGSGTFVYMAFAESPFQYARAR